MKTIYQKILLGMDASEKAKRAAERVMEFQKKWNSQIVVFHSIEHHMVPQALSIAAPMEDVSSYEIPAQAYDKIRETYKKRGEHVLANTENMFRENDLSVETRLVKESPEDYISNVVEEKSFDLVVVGCTGEHSKLERIFLGTVAEAVVNNAPCDVLIVR